MTRTLLFFLLTVLTFTSHAQTIQVPQDFESIQSAIDASSQGDSIHIAPGTYVENLVIPHELTFYSDFLTTQNMSDVEATVLDGDSSGAVILAKQPLGNRLEFIGLTVQNGTGHPYAVGLFSDSLYLNFGGGLHVTGVSEFILDHMIIRENQIFTEHNSGGGVFAEQCGVEISDCIVEENLVQGGSFFGEGGGLCFYDCDVEIYNSVVQNNIGMPGYCEGAGIFALNSDIYLNGVDILNNIGPGSAAFNFSESTAEMINCNIIGNVASFTDVFRFYTFNQNSEFIVEDCFFAENQGRQGGTFSIISAQATISGTTFENNSAAFGPVCLNITNSDFTIENSLFSGGNCSEGSSLSCDAGALKTYLCTGTVRNTVMTDNSSVSSSGFAEGGAIDFGQSNILLDSVIVQGNIANRGGAIRAYASDIVLLNSALLNNEGDLGGALFSLNSNWKIIKSTIAGNSGNSGAGIWTSSDSLYIINSILWNEAGDEIHGSSSQSNDTSTSHIAYSTVRGLDAHFANQGFLETTWHAGNTEDAPLFVNAPAGNYQLAAGSPQVDAGIPFFELNDEVLVDMEEFLGAAPDMGYSESLVTALRDDPESLFSIFPNPVGDVLNINGPVHNIEQIQLFDMQGKSIASERSGANTLKVDDLRPGAYHLRLRHATGTESLTLIKR